MRKKEFIPVYETKHIGSVVGRSPYDLCYCEFCDEPIFRGDISYETLCGFCLLAMQVGGW